MFRRILIANRGEIARRIIRACKKLSIESILVVSEADEKAAYVKEANRAVLIGPALSSESYLCEDAILQAALETDSEAIHPGFGFLSEKARFASRCEEQKLTFIGPPPALMRLMGDKAEARKTMKRLGMPVLIGSSDVVSDLKEAQKQALELGFPVLIKARAGGGGKGMRLVEKAQDLPEAFMEARREALAAFSDSEVYIEKFVVDARHIEFQILGDSFGNVVCLGERECSIQRNNQKLIEEAPANGFSEVLRREMAEKLCGVMQQIGYVNAGTVEFLLDRSGKLFFMEMNTRIQVEHPVTELVYGVDIVCEQIRIACNEPLRLKPDLRANGHAIECRINAEDPFEHFKPSPGTITKWQAPPNDEKGPVRLDTHVEAGYTMPPFYDSMLGKLIVWGPTRAEAVRTLLETLEAFQIEGVKTTLPLHKRIVQKPDFLEGTYDCSFLKRHADILKP